MKGLVVKMVLFFILIQLSCSFLEDPDGSKAEKQREKETNDASIRFYAPLILYPDRCYSSFFTSSNYLGYIKLNDTNKCREVWNQTLPTQIYDEKNNKLTSNTFKKSSNLGLQCRGDLNELDEYKPYTWYKFEKSLTTIPNYSSSYLNYMGIANKVFTHTISNNSIDNFRDIEIGSTYYCCLRTDRAACNFLIIE